MILASWATDQPILSLADTSGQSSPGTVAGGGTTWQQVSVGNQHTVAIAQ